MTEFKDLLTIILDLKYSKFINKKYRICINKDCNKNPAFNYKNESKRLYCSVHKLDNMIDIKNKIKCININCNKQPTYNYENEKKPLYCSTHKLIDMINIVSKRCINKNCNKQPLFNYKDKTNALYCGCCKLDDMIDVKHKKCININCNKRPTYNYKNEKKALYCNNCKLTDMVDIKNKKCINQNCDKQPAFNFKNKKNALYCGNCKLTDMVNVKSKMCQLCNHIQSKKKYDYLCYDCYYYTKPDSVLTRNHKTKENQLISDLNKELNNNIIIQDKRISNENGCSKRRPDGLIKLNDYNIIIEIDENQHSNYICENRRIMEIFEDLGHSLLTVIRFNPDAYKLDNKKIKSPFGITKTDGRLKIINQKEYNNRFNKLLETINYNIKNIPNKEINVINLFYNS
jgi:hypothetical protein